MKNPHSDNRLRTAMTHAYRMDEEKALEDLQKQAAFSEAEQTSIAKIARDLVQEVRSARLNQGGLDAFLYQYDLSSEEGIVLMCLAEALLRIPDSATREKLTADKLSSANWQAHLGSSTSTFVNAATWGLMLTGKMVSPAKRSEGYLKKIVAKVAGRSTSAMIRQAMKILGRQFVMGETIDSALKRAEEMEKKGYRFSYDMLGEAARTQKDADRYLQSYKDAIARIGKAANGRGPVASPGISVKLSALHPRYEYTQTERVVRELTPKLLELATLAKQYQIGLTVDAEEADRLDLSLDIIEKVFSNDALQGWEGFGLAVQSYQKRAPYVLDFVIDLGRRHGRRLMVRLIKGAYWDTEIKLAQEFGLLDYPVFTRKVNTDVSFLACAKKIAGATDAIYPQFATHNAHSVAAVLTMMGDNKDFEFQCLHGMGETLYDQVVGADKFNIPARVYAPVGNHQDLLPYLVRRLLENGANSSFVNRIVNEKVPVDDIIACPVKQVEHNESIRHPQIPLPVDLYTGYRRNSLGIDLSHRGALSVLEKSLSEIATKTWVAMPTVATSEDKAAQVPVTCPTDVSQVVGQVQNATDDEVTDAVAKAKAAFDAWDKEAVETRAACLEKCGDLLQTHQTELMSLAVREAGKTLPDAIAEIREAIDFCYYYAEQGRMQLSAATRLPGPTGEENSLAYSGRGVIACISPWNFPLAIFLGQVTAALMAGNTVVAKPAEQTPLIAARAVALLHEAGVPKDVVQLLPGTGEVVGAALTAHPDIAGVIFTGSTETAKLINQSLAARGGSIAPLIAETGGQNAMIVDSSALPEQVVLDVIRSAFGSAGQRCSALRVLFVQEDIADGLIDMLQGAMAELVVGDPALLNTDVGPVVDSEAKDNLLAHINRMKDEAKLIYAVSVPQEFDKSGTFISPVAFEISGLEQLPREVFGPVLHVVRYSAKSLGAVLDNINETGYGLTLGVHSRIDETIKFVRQRAKVGNLYVNRNMIGAVVGVQPFGGEGLSGTGPKAGGPHYLHRLCVERCVSINTTAAGGNATLMSLGE